MTYPTSVPRFSFKLQKAMIAVAEAQRQYDYYYGLRRDENGCVIKGPSFSASAEKNAYSRLLRAQAHLRNMERYWNTLYDIWHSYEIKFDALESDFANAEIEAASLTQEMADIQTKISISSIGDTALLVTKFAETCTKQDRVLRTREYIRGQIKKLSNKKPQEVPSLDEIKATFNAIEGGRITQEVYGVEVTPVPDSLKSLQADIIRRNKADHVRIEPTATDIVDIMKGFFDEPEKKDEEK